MIHKCMPLNWYKWMKFTVLKSKVPNFLSIRVYFQIIKQNINQKEKKEKECPYCLPNPNILVFWTTRRLTFDLLIYLKAWMSSCFPLNSRNSPRTYLLPLTSNLHMVKNLFPSLLNDNNPNI